MTVLLDLIIRLGNGQTVTGNGQFGQAITIRQGQRLCLTLFGLPKITNQPPDVSRETYTIAVCPRGVKEDSIKK